MTQMTDEKRQDRIKEILNIHEGVIYQAYMSAAVYSIPIFIGFVGACIVFLTSDIVIQHLPEQMMAVGERWIYGAKDTFLGFWMLAGGIAFTVKFHLHRKNVIQIVTNQRVVQVVGTFVHETHELPLHYIEDMKIKRGTILHRFLHLGDVTLINKYGDRRKAEKEKQGLFHAVGAGEEREIVFKSVSNPDDFVENIEKSIQRYGAAAAAQEEYKNKRK